MIMGQTFHFLFAVTLFEISLILCSLFPLLLSQGQLFFQPFQLDVLAHNRLLPQLNALAFCLKFLNEEFDLIQLAQELRISLQEFAPPFKEEQKKALLLLLVPPCSLFIIHMIVLPVFAGELGEVDHAIADHQCQHFFAVSLLLIGTSEVPSFGVQVVQFLLLSIVSLDQVIQLSLQFASFPLQHFQFLELVFVLFTCTLTVPLALRDSISHRINLLRKRLFDILEKCGHSLDPRGRLPPLIHELRTFPPDSLDVTGQLTIFDCDSEDILEQFVIEIPVGVKRTCQGVILVEVGGADYVRHGLFGC